MKLLIAGFEPFGNFNVNPSQQLVESFHTYSSLSHLQVFSCVLPVSFEHAFTQLKKKVNECAPDIVLGTGLSSSQNGITLESVATNVMDAEIPDNDGRQPCGEALIPGAPHQLFTHLPVQQMSKVCQDSWMTACVSHHAGTYVCNALMYQAIYDGLKHDYLAGFVHVPFVKDTHGLKRRIEQMFEEVSFF